MTEADAGRVQSRRDGRSGPRLPQGLHDLPEQNAPCVATSGENRLAGRFCHPQWPGYCAHVVTVENSREVLRAIDLRDWHVVSAPARTPS